MKFLTFMLIFFFSSGFEFNLTNPQKTTANAHHHRADVTSNGNPNIQCIIKKNIIHMFSLRTKISIFFSIWEEWNFLLLRQDSFNLKGKIM